MKFETLTRLVDAVTPAQLRELALAVLRWTSDHPQVVDGPYDGGQDIRLMGGDGAILPMVVTCSVERDWERKLRSPSSRHPAGSSIQPPSVTSSAW